MANRDPLNIKNGTHPVIVALYFIGAVLSGAGGNYLWMRNVAPEVVAPDRFTGTEADALEFKIDTHLANHPDIEYRFDARLTALEAQYAIILTNQQRILDRLDRLNSN